MISRRSFIASSLAATALPMPALASYKPDAFVMDTWRSLKDSTTPVIFNFRASWSHTCEIKADILDAILCEGDRYSDLSIVEVDWDTFGPSQMAERLKVRRQSTLVALRGREVQARLENEPFEHRVRAFLDQAVAAF